MSHHGAIKPYPLLFTPVLLEKVWGGRRLERLGKRLLSHTVGESWELADLDSTSASGAGGGAIRSVIRNGPLAGKTLRQALDLWREGLIGCSDSLVRARRDGFGLLLKFLDAHQNLSVQVHPSRSFLRRHPDAGAHLKTESWFIVDAEPGAKLYIGLKPGVTRSEFARRIAENSVIDALVAVPAVVGDCHTLPSGTIHALGSGVLVAEVQTPSDTTFRVYDWARQGRTLHVAESLDCATFADTPSDDRTPPPEPPSRLRQGQLCARLATTEFYTIDQARPGDGDELTIGYRCAARKNLLADHRPDRAVDHSGPPGCFVIIVLAGQGQLVSSDNAFDPIPLSIGETVLIPSAVSLGSVLRAHHGLNVLRVGLI